MASEVVGILEAERGMATAVEVTSDTPVGVSLGSVSTVAVVGWVVVVVWVVVDVVSFPSVRGTLFCPG